MERDVPGTVRRPLLILTLAFAAGIATGVRISFPAGPLLIAAALVLAVLFSFWWLGNSRDNRRNMSGWIGAAGLLVVVFLAGTAYVSVRQSAAKGTVVTLATGTDYQGREATIEGTVGHGDRCLLAEGYRLGYGRPSSGRVGHRRPEHGRVAFREREQESEAFVA